MQKLPSYLLQDTVVLPTASEPKPLADLALQKIRTGLSLVPYDQV